MTIPFVCGIHDYPIISVAICSFVVERVSSIPSTLQPQLTPSCLRSPRPCDSNSPSLLAMFILLTARELLLWPALMALCGCLIFGACVLHVTSILLPTYTILWTSTASIFKFISDGSAGNGFQAGSTTPIPGSSSSGSGQSIKLLTWNSSRLWAAVHHLCVLWTASYFS